MSTLGNAANMNPIGIPQIRGTGVGSHWWSGGPGNANVVWQNTSSNATYCSASSALAK